MHCHSSLAAKWVDTCMSLTSCMFSKNKLGLIRVCNGFVACTSVLDVCCSSSSAQLAAAKFYGFVFEVSGGDFLVDGSNASSIQFKVDEEMCEICEITRDQKAVLLTSSASTANHGFAHMIMVHSMQVRAGFEKHTFNKSFSNQSPSFRSIHCSKA